LRVDDLPLKVFETGNISRKGLLVIIVAGCENDEASSEMKVFLLGLDLGNPRVFSPFHGENTVVEKKSILEAMAGYRVVEILQNISALGNRI